MENYRKNFSFSHKAGILMPVSSLPSEYGIGTFGKGAFDFIDFLVKTGQKCWQVLPLNPTSYGDSPYQSPASGAGNPYFIDPQILCDKGLLTKDELKEYVFDKTKVDYGYLFYKRYQMLALAFSRFKKNRSYNIFVKKNESWIDDYALFMALKVKYNYASWTTWNECDKNITIARMQKDDYTNEMNFWKWIQYEFTQQWKEVIKYAHSKGILIIGDMPIYVAHDSMDVWKDPKQFELDESYNPVRVAGCPPDGFTPDGQRWGNPLYNWDLMKQDGFSWWIKRIKRSFELYDILRIDHFRGFASFYAIPACDENARRGVWIPAPGKELFRTIRKALPNAKIIAEDLGFITDDVRELLEDTGFPGMKILQFAFFDDDSEYLPRTYNTKNCIVYTGSHDSDCTLTWYQNLEGEAKVRLLNECPFDEKMSKVYSIIKLAMTSIGNLVVIPIQDYLELTNEEGRMNVPSVADGNWSWRINKDYAKDELIEKIRDLLLKTNRYYQKNVK